MDMKIIQPISVINKQGKEIKDLKAERDALILEAIDYIPWTIVGLIMWGSVFVLLYLAIFK